MNGNTYGTWLPGDPRGWRTTKHRQHVEGDYRNPPAPGEGKGLHQHAREHLRREEVFLEPSQLPIVGRALVEMLLHQDVELLVLSVGQGHFHLLGRFPDGEVRPRVGRAKKHAVFTLRDQGGAGPGGLWAGEGHVRPIHDRSHQVNTFNYIREHSEKGAWIWVYTDGITWTVPPQLSHLNHPPTTPE